MAGRNPNSRSVVVTVRLSPKEVAELDRARGHLSRSLWLRGVLEKEMRALRLRWRDQGT